MGKKPKFKCEITKIKLSPEQAVLSCGCSTVGFYAVENELPYHYNAADSHRPSCGTSRAVYTHWDCNSSTDTGSSRTVGHDGDPYS